MHDTSNPNTIAKRPQNKQKFETIDSIVKNLNTPHDQHVIPKQNNSKKTHMQWEQEEEETSLIEESTGCNSLNEVYTKICKNNSVYRLHDTIVCKAHVECIMRLSKQKKNKSLAIIDSGADTHIFGHACTPLFTQDNHTPLADLIRFDEAFSKKRDLPIGPHATLAKLNNGKNIILRAEHGVSNPTANHTLLCTFECRELGIIIDDCHKRHYKSLDGIKGTQSIQFHKYTTIDLTCRAVLMTFETEKLNL